jgi:hypothetical protein
MNFKFDRSPESRQINGGTETIYEAQGTIPRSELYCLSLGTFLGGLASADVAKYVPGFLQDIVSEVVSEIVSDAAKLVSEVFNFVTAASIFFTWQVSTNDNLVIGARMPGGNHGFMSLIRIRVMTNLLSFPCYYFQGSTMYVLWFNTANSVVIGYGLNPPFHDSYWPNWNPSL